MTSKQIRTREKYAQFKLTKDTKEVEKFPFLDEEISRRMQAEFIKGNKTK